VSNDAEEVEQQLELLLAESADAARQRETETFGNLGGSESGQIVLFGAGNLGRRTLAGLRKVGIEPACFVDNNEGRWGQNIEGLSVLSPQEGARRYGEHATFVVTIWGALGADRMNSRIASLRQMGCKTVVPFVSLYWKYSDIFLPHYTIDQPHKVLLQCGQVREAFYLMANPQSRREYIEQLRFRLFGDFSCLRGPVQGAIYFQDDLFRLEKNEIFVDCGAFDGDTISLFLEKTARSFERIIAFEPDPTNFQQLTERVSAMPSEVFERISLIEAATGESDSQVRMTVGAGPSSQLGLGDCQVKCVALDSVLKEVPVSIIKMDIEGSELAALSGSRQLIKQFSPVLAVSAYHKQEDLWNIPLFLHNLNLNYSFHLRPHMIEGWDLVCYAIPSSRKR
jgi:FkbM family methyltransferase